MDAEQIFFTNTSLAAARIDANHALNQPISRSISSLDQPLNNEQYVTGWSQFGSIRAAAGAVPAFTPARLPIARLTLRLTAYTI